LATLPAELSRLERVPANDIVKSLGEERARVARTREEIEVRVGLARVGRELFPALIIAVALVLAAEQLLANRFYASSPISNEKQSVILRGGDKESGRQGEIGKRTNLPLSPAPTLPVSPVHT
jgi:hypothetical protein